MKYHDKSGKRDARRRNVKHVRRSKKTSEHLRIGRSFSPTEIVGNTHLVPHSVELGPLGDACPRCGKSKCYCSCKVSSSIVELCVNQESETQEVIQKSR